MKKEQDKRRSFLKHILAGTAVVAGATAVIKPAKASGGPATRSQSDEVLYKESGDFKKYYKSLRS